MFNVEKSIAAVFILLGFTGPAGAANDLVTKRSVHPFAEMLDRLEAAAKQNGLTVFCATGSRRRRQISWAQDAACNRPSWWAIRGVAPRCSCSIPRWRLTCR
jgi:hypothetical protein